MVRITGRLFLAQLRGLGGVTLLGVQALRIWLTHGLRIQNLLATALHIGVQSLPIVSLSALFTGMVLVVQVGNQFMNLGAENIIGGVVGLSLSREMSPLIVSVILAARVGSSMAAEIGTMKVTEQLDAMKLLSADPVSYLVLPRLAACTISTPLLVVYSNVVGICGGFLVAVTQIGVNPELFIQSLKEMVAAHDLIGGLLKSALFGFLIALIGCYRGLNTEGGARGVGLATTSSVVQMITSILILNYFYSLGFFAWLKASGLT